MVMVVAEMLETLCQHAYAILNNLGNIMYVVVAVVSGVYSKTFLVWTTPLHHCCIPCPLPLNMIYVSTRSINQISSQINSVVMGIAGANRVFELLDEPELWRKALRLR